MSDLFTHEALRGRLTDAGSVRRFVLAGRATLTLVSRRTGERFTYSVQRARDDGSGREPPLFVKLLSGPDNTSDYSYMGSLFAGRMHELARTRKSRVGADAPSWKAFSWLAWHLFHASGKADEAVAQLEVWHEGRCGRCGRKLTVPESIYTGFGPECAERMRGAP